MKDYMFLEGVKIQGLEPKSSAAAMMTRTLMETWLNDVLKDKDVGKANAPVIYAWKNFELIARKDMTQIGIPRGLSNSNYEDYMGGGLQPWAIGCIGARDVFGKRFTEDDKPKCIYTKPTTKYPHTSICITEETELWDGVKVDWRKQRNKVLKDKFKELFEAVGIDWKSAMVGKKQTGLEAFFS